MTMGGGRHAGDMPIEHIDDLSRGVSKMQPYHQQYYNPYQQQQQQPYYAAPQQPYYGGGGYVDDSGYGYGGAYDEYTTNW